MLKQLGIFQSLAEVKRDVLQQKSSSANLDVVKKPRGKPNDVSIKESLPPPRKSSRKRKPVLYNVDEEESEDAPRRRRAKREAEDEESYYPQKDECATSQSPSPTKKRRTSSRKKVAINYNEDAAEEQIPATDSYIWCSQCNAQQFNGCELHPPLFASMEDFNLKIEKSAVAKNAGEGVFNRGEIIKEGTVFGPYQGKFYPKAAYQKKIQAGEESGNAWEIKDQDGLKVVAYIDPGNGKSLDPKLHWLTKINCATNSHAQNMVGFQLHGQIYYRVTQDIVNGAELLVDYGQEYAKELGINVKLRDRFKGEEDHREESWECEGCLTNYSSQSALHIHQDTSALETCFKFAKHDRELICKGCKNVFNNGKVLVNHQTSFCFPNRYRKTAAQESNKCGICFKVFSAARYMLIHMRNIHAKIKDLKCPTCGKAFSQKSHLTRHIKAVHQMSRPHQCPDCGQSFARASDMKRHREALHLGTRYPCTWTPPPGDYEEHTFSCNKTFTDKASLDRHIKNCHLWNYRFECQVCLDKDVWWGCMTRGDLEKHMKSKHPKEYQSEQEAYIAKHPFVCKYAKCKKRFETEVEVARHLLKLH